MLLRRRLKLKLLLPQPCYVHDYMLIGMLLGISSFVNQQVCFFSGIDNRLCRSRVPTNHNPPPSLLFSGKSLSKHPSERNNAMNSWYRFQMNISAIFTKVSLNKFKTGMFRVE